MSEAGRRPQLCLVYVEDGRTRVLPVPEGTTTLGSAVDNDVVIERGDVRPHHLVLLRDRDTIELRDLFAGVTRVNGEDRRSGELRAGDVLGIGELSVRVLRVAARDTARLQSAASPRSAAAPPEPAPPEAAPPEPAPPEPAPAPGADRPAPDESAGTARFSSSAARRAPTDSADADELRQLREREARRARAVARARQLSDELTGEQDFEVLLERIAVGFLELFDADRAVTILFEEDGRNPLLTVERCREGTDEGAGIAQEIVDRCLQVRSVLRVSGGHEGLGGLAAPLLSDGRALGMLYFERVTSQGQPFEAEDVHLMALIANQAGVVIAPLVT